MHKITAFTLALQAKLNCGNENENEKQVVERKDRGAHLCVSARDDLGRAISVC